jgi:hypothetical protein
MRYPEASADHLQAARPIHISILIILGLMGLILLAGGVYLGATEKLAQTNFTLFGNKFDSTSVGVAVAFVGVVMIVLVIRGVLRSVDTLARLKD